MLTLKNEFRKPMVLSLMIGLGFLWASSAYISQMYHLNDLTTPEHIDRITLGYNYFAQAMGAFLVLITSKRNHKFWLSSPPLLVTMIIAALSIIVTLNVQSLLLVVVTGLIMNFCHGILTGLYLLYLGLFPTNHRGIIFGFAYAVGSLSTFLLSRFIGTNGSGLATATFAYLILIILNILFLKPFMFDIKATFSRSIVDYTDSPSLQLLQLFKTWSPLFLLLFLMAVISALGGDYRSAYIFSDIVDFQQTRVYYALGLITAGFLTDLNRKLGAHLCIVAIFFPFISISLKSVPETIQLIWNLSYFFLAFYTVFRVVVTVDLVNQDSSLFFLASAGFILSRIGDVLFSAIPKSLFDSTSKATIVAVLLSLALLFTYLKVYFKLYHATSLLNSDDQKENTFHTFTDQHDLTLREKDVFNAILAGYSNSEISTKLYISESTVKFHVKNLLKKTDCHNRTELLKKYHEDRG